MFFFFQAEDGIRDYKVTGVQTCALPISEQRIRFLSNIQSETHRIQGLVDRMLKLAELEGRRALGSRVPVALAAIVRTILRSEERRVGKECRSRWSPYH